MWTKANRATYDRKALRYPSDLTDAEWDLIEPHLPPPRKSRRHEALDRREVLNAILYLLRTGCQWRLLPKDFPKWTGVYGYFNAWHCDGVLTRVHHAFYEDVRRQAGREAAPTLSIVDSQSVRSAEKGGRKLIRRGTMAARRSRAKSATSASTSSD